MSRTQILVVVLGLAAALAGCSPEEGGDDRAAAVAVEDGPGTPVSAPDTAGEAFTGDALADEIFRMLCALITLEADAGDRDAMVERLRAVIDAEEVGLPERRLAAVRGIVDEILVRIEQYRPRDGRPGEVSGQQKQFVVDRARDWARGLRATIESNSEADMAPINHAGAMMMAPALDLLDVPEGYRKVSWRLLGSYTWRDDVEIPAEVMALDGEKVAVAGFMMSLGAYEDAHAFLMVESAWTCCFGLAPDVNQAVEVRIPQDERGVAIVTMPVLVTGVLRIEKQVEQGFVVGIYRIEADDVVEAD